MLTMAGMGLFLYLSVLALIGWMMFRLRAFLAGGGSDGGRRFLCLG